MNNRKAEIYLDPTTSPISNYFIFTDRTSESTKKFIKGAFKLLPVTGSEADWVLGEEYRFEPLDDCENLVCSDSPFKHEPNEGRFLLGKDILAHIDFARA